MEPIVGEINIIPRPTSITRLGGQFEITATTKIVALDESAIRTSTILSELLVENYGLRLAITTQAEDENTIIFLGTLETDTPDNDEGYGLKIESERIRISGTERGMFYAVQTLNQMLPLDSASGIKVPAAEIIDSPRFQYRGMHLDVARHMMPVEFVKKYIDVISRYKYNYFHWHLTDDQGWRIEIRKYPKLTEVGSRRKETVVAKNYKPYVGDGIPVDGFYTQEQIREIVAFAESRHVTIVPEIDMPGHASAALAAYPEFGCRTDRNYSVKTSWGGFPDVLCPTDETFGFVEDVLSEVIDLFPNSPYIHIGGDEVSTDQWRASPEVRELMRRENLTNDQEVLLSFVRRVDSFVASRGKQTIGWDEILDGRTSGGHSIVMAWQDQDRVSLAARRGRNVIATPSDFTYFDYPQGDPSFEPLALGGELPLEKVYSFEPVPPGLNAVEARLILGGQGCVWTEFIKQPQHVEYMAFPRAMALAEVLWSTKSARNFLDFSKRLRGEFARLDQAGVMYRIPKPIGIFDHNLRADDKAVVALEPPIENGTIFFTLDGSVPTKDSRIYKQPFILDVNQGVLRELRVRVVSTGGRESSVFTARYQRNSTFSGQFPSEQKRDERVGRQTPTKNTGKARKNDKTEVEVISRASEQ